MESEFGELASSLSREEWRRKYKVLLVYYITCICIQILTVFDSGTNESNKLCFGDVFEEMYAQNYYNIFVVWGFLCFMLFTHVPVIFPITVHFRY